MAVNAAPAYDLGPIGVIALMGALLALGPLAWVWLRERAVQPGERSSRRLRALTVVTLFLTFDLVLFGAFTRLSDSGLGCPDWPGCYGHASPLGAHARIGAEQQALPSGAVTHGKAWVEMTHRYLATGVGVLITVLAVLGWVGRRHRSPSSPSPWWATITLLWVCLQGAFGALTVTMKLYPAIVTLHLLGGIGLLALLAVQTQAGERGRLSLSPTLHAGAWIVALLCVVQVALGGWVSTNYAVLACSDFPTCQGVWWPAMDFEHGFTLQRALGEGKGGDYLPFAALTAIHVTHRLGAVVVVGALAGLVWRLSASGDPALRRWALVLGGVVLWQVASGLSNVVLGWPIVAAIAHTGGAAVLITLLAMLLTRAQPAAAPLRVAEARGGPLHPAT